MELDPKLTRAILVQTFLVQVLAALAIFTVPVLATDIAADLGLDPVVAGLYTATLFAGAIAGSALAGRVAQVVGAFAGSLASIVLIGLGIAVLSAGWLPLLAPSVLFAGFGYGLVNPTASALLVRVTRPERRGWVFSVKQTGVPLGSALGGFLAPPLAHAIGWQATLFLISALCVLVVLPFAGIALRGFRQGRGSGESPPGGVGLLRTHRPLLVLASGSFALAALQLCLSTFLTAHLVLNGGLSLVAAGQVFACSQIGGAVARPLWGRLADWTGSAARTLGLIGVLGSIAGFLTAILNPDWPLPAMILLSTWFGATSLAWNGVFFAEIVRLVRPEEAAAATGGVQLFTYSGIVAGPLLFAAVASLAGGFGPAYAVLAAVALPGAIAIGAMAGRDRRG
ncbi:MFS transporter [Geminicoccus roseus]|uniref:MFS transporter n=1 Tax=Geminicoccus roseus TaxID=404900 RepID=UPI00041F3B51|nr:MFS transporter [Geminicoccus roseus]